MLTRGLTTATGLTDAWLLTGGLDAGMARVIGEHVARNQHTFSAPLIGCVGWHSIAGREQLESSTAHSIAHSAKGPKRVYSSEAPSERNTAVLEPNHTHFLFVESTRPPAQGANPWTSHSAYADSFVAHAAERFGCPSVVLLVQGSDAAIATVLDAAERRSVVVVGAFTGGFATALYDYCCTGVVPESQEGMWLRHTAAFERIRALNAAESARIALDKDNTVHHRVEYDEELIARGLGGEDELGGDAEAESKWPLLVFYTGSEVLNDDVSESLLYAVRRRADRQKRVLYAVKW